MNMKIVAIGGSLLGLAVGGVAGYLIAKKRLEADYANWADQEIAATKAYLNEQYKASGRPLERRTPSVPESPMDRDGEPFDKDIPEPEVLKRVLTGLKYGKPTDEIPTFNIWKGRDNGQPLCDDPSVPYVISQEEFMAEELNHEQVTLTYYAEDDVLADDADMPVQETEQWVGDANLERFGHHSNDPRVVYVRNERMHIDFEICRHDGSFAELVHGIEKKQEARSPRKFRE